MTKRRKRETLDALLARLNADPEWVANRADEEAERDKRAAEWTRAEAPLVAELQSAGFDVSSAWDLVNTSAPYPKALPILLKHLRRPYPDRVREGIARALAVPEAKYAISTLIEEYRHADASVPYGAKDGLAAAIAAASEDDTLDEVIELIRDPGHGGSRLILLAALEKSRDPRARAALMAAGADPDLTLEVEHILKKLSRRRSRKK